MDQFINNLNDSRAKRMLEKMRSDEYKQVQACSDANNELISEVEKSVTNKNHPLTDIATKAENVVPTTSLGDGHVNVITIIPVPSCSRRDEITIYDSQPVTVNDILEADIVFGNIEVMRTENSLHTIEETPVHNIHLDSFKSVTSCTIDIEDSRFTKDTETDQNDEDYIPNESVLNSNESSENITQKHNQNNERQILNEEERSQEKSINEAKKSRKRNRNESMWARNVKKFKVNKGEAYTTKSGNFIKEKTVKTACGNNCKLKCSEKLSLDQRQTLLTDFLSLKDINRKRDFISKLMDEVNPKYSYKKDNSHRSSNYSYYFMVDGKRLRVCKHMFTNTLCISSTFLTTVKKKTAPTGLVTEDLRGKHMNQPKIDPLIIKSIFDHINSFARIESHYCRADTKREYIDGDLDLAEMYRMYKSNCTEKGIPYAKKHKYEEIFNTKFNIGFFVPKKDQCAFCAAYENSSEQEKQQMQARKDIHDKEKKISRQEKDRDKKFSRNPNSDTVVACFDLQAVVQMPKGQISTFFYKRKLNTFNFTIYDATFKQGYSYIWHEGCAKRGALEIASFIYDYLKEQCRGGKNIVFYSDNCSGQNKNYVLLTMYLYAVKTLNIPSITHIYLIVGHTQNEGDTMHSAIERQVKKATKKTPLYIPSQLVAIVQVANKERNPFVVKEMDTKDVIDWKGISSSFGKNFQVSTVGEKIVWADVKMFEVKKELPNTVFYKTSYEQEEMMSFNLDDKIIKKKDGSIEIIPRGLSSVPSTPRSSKSRIAKSKASKIIENSPSNRQPIVLKPAFQVSPGISTLKKADLLSLCDEKLIPTPYHQFFRDLKIQQKLSSDESSENE